MQLKHWYTRKQSKKSLKIPLHKIINHSFVDFTSSVKEFLEKHFLFKEISHIETISRQGFVSRMNEEVKNASNEISSLWIEIVTKNN